MAYCPKHDQEFDIFEGCSKCEEEWTNETTTRKLTNIPNKAKLIKVRSASK